MSYIPQNQYKPENLKQDEEVHYVRPQGFEKVKQYDTPPPPVHEIKHQITLTGGFQPITVTTEQPHIAPPQGFLIAPGYKLVYQKQPVVDEVYQREQVKQDTQKYYERPNRVKPNNYETVTETIYERPSTDLEFNRKEEEEARLKDSRNSLAIILKKLQESNTLPHTLTADNIDNSIKTLVQILNNLKQTHKNVEVVTETPIRNYDIKPVQGPVENIRYEEDESDEEHLEDEGIFTIY